MSVTRYPAKWFMVACAAALALFVAGCGGGGGGGATASLSGGTGGIGGTGLKGPVQSASVTAYGISGGMLGAPIGSATTDINGNFTIAIGSYAGPVMLQLRGGTYTDEATGSTMAMAAGDVLTALLPSVAAGAMVTGIQVTPLTSMAQAMAHNMSGGLTDANINAANKAVGDYFNVTLGGGDILHTVPMNPLVAGSGSGAAQNAINYGMVVAAMSQYAQTLGMSSSSAIVTAMMNDASDGMMDGMMGAGNPVMMGGGLTGTRQMVSTAGTGALSTAMTTFISNVHNLSGVGAAAMQTLTSKLSGSGGQLLALGTPITSRGAGTAFYGPVSQGMVSAYAIANGAAGAQIASVATDAQGNYTLPLGSYTGPLMLQVSGANYIDEATGSAMPTTATGDVMTAVVTSIGPGAALTGIQITPLTSMAQTLALGTAGGMTDTNIAAANTRVAGYFNFTVGGDILRVVPINTLTSGSATAPGVTADMKDYGLAIAAMSESAHTLGMTVSSAAFVTAMMNDAADGIMNGMMGGNPIAMGGGMMGGSMMSSSAGWSGLVTAISNFLTLVPTTVNRSGLTNSDAAAMITKLNLSQGRL